MWFQQETYPELVKRKWQNYNRDIISKVNMLASDLQKWNTNVVGNIFRKKRKLLARITGIQESLCKKHNPFLLNLEEDLIREYEQIRDQEAVYWQQKSRVTWLQNGDRNTKFFHLSTMVRRRRNKIEGLLNQSGELCTDLPTMKNIAAAFFQALFTHNPSEDIRFVIPYLFPNLDIDAINWMSRSISVGEVHSALFSIRSLKVPGVDGFPALFYKKHWNLLFAEILSLVTDAFILMEKFLIVSITTSLLLFLK
ncbi:uncharacterized protein LOC112163733 [Rosa chinensis]|uniref:uncharacterized protein LOC112163733 n=1 Tax=Rosa chinensis TaxID=74649 RepID=UPI000D088966|nr:uncharacterized protein LOC112163733 [Rosa chinensis]